MKAAIFLHLAAMLLVFTGCSGKLRPDSSLAAITAGYPTAEFQACGRLHNGLGLCVIEEGTSISSISLKVQGYDAGEIKIDSNDCTFMSTPIKYSKNALVPVALKDNGSKFCVVTMTVSPSYESANQNGIKIHGFRGHLYVKTIKKGEDIETTFFKESGNWKKLWNIKTGEVAPVRLFSKGCGITVDKKVTPKEDTSIDIHLQNHVGPQNQTCVVEGVVQGEVYKDLLLTVLVSQYESAFVPLAPPTVSVEKGKITLEASDSVSVISVGNEYTFQTKATFKVDLSKTFIVRALTVKGRSAIGQWDPKKQAVVWLP